MTSRPRPSDTDHDGTAAIATLARTALETDSLEQVLTQAITTLREALSVAAATIVAFDGTQATPRAGLDGGSEPAIEALEAALVGPATVGSRTEAIESFEAAAGKTSSFVGVRCRLTDPAALWGELLVVGDSSLHTESARPVLEGVVEVLEGRLAMEPARTARERMATGRCSLDPSFRITFADEHARAAIGHPDPIGRPLWEAITHASDAHLQRACEQAMAAGETNWVDLEPAGPGGVCALRLDPAADGLTVTVHAADGPDSPQAELREQNRTLKSLYEITADRDRSFDDKVEALLELGRQRLGLEIGFVANVDQADDRFQVVQSIGDERLEPGSESSLSETYCRRTIQGEDLLVLTNTSEAGWADDEAYAQWDFDSYVGGKVHVDGDLYGTLCFADDAPTSAAFTTGQLRFVRLAMQWLGMELERRHNQAELESVLAALETSNERLEQFAYVTSHDLQEPLRTVTNYLTLLERRCGDALDEDGQEFLSFALGGAERMGEMIDGLLGLSRVETQAEPFEQTDLTAVVAAVERDLQLQLDESNAELTVGELPTVPGDGRQLRQLFQNLLSNAITYSGDEPPVVSIDADRVEDHWHLRIRDEGIGMPAEETSYVFEVFGRLHSHAERPGSGMGLAICERIVDRHDGEIWIESAPEEGTTVHVTLPAGV